MGWSRTVAGALGTLAVAAPSAAAQDSAFDGRVLVVKDAEQASLDVRGARLEIDFGSDGDAEFLVPRSRLDLVRVNDVGTVAFEGSRFELSANGDRARVVGKVDAELDGIGIARIAGTTGTDTLAVGDPPRSGRVLTGRRSPAPRTTTRSRSARSGCSGRRS